MSDDNKSPREHQLDALARSQAWLLTMYQCLHHELNTEAPRAVQHELIDILNEGDGDGLNAVTGELGLILAEILGSDQAVRLIEERVSTHTTDRDATIALAELVAAHFGGGSHRAAANMLRCTETAKFWCLVGDEFDSDPGDVS
ncbi:hypothetical protein [Mycolicibacterium fluoranthenivorans]|uniref:Uncharacterized protein n=1 Tax=Mycolicibacterium fluoranthenivorans TaxID=258505 RepID=A0A1G4WQ41_9MYCO|nr:hypothetical protein [Mycolicibacterium fluoranthenivorans]SCX27236.1 hypothetical protein SAMN02799620_04255 [Mycolicibacterium fluoranthenivorans]